MIDFNAEIDEIVFLAFLLGHRDATDIYSSWWVLP